MAEGGGSHITSYNYASKSGHSFAIKKFRCIRTFSFFSIFIFLIAESIIGQETNNKGLFESNDTFTVTLSGNIKELLKNRSGEPKEFPFTLSYTGNDNKQIFLQVQLSTRGHFRRMKENCTYPPLLIRFNDGNDQISTVFKEQKKLKLVMPCRGDDYVIKEWLVYKIYNLITPKSFRARLVKIELNDSTKGKAIEPFYGMFLEEEKQMATRNNSFAIERKLKPEMTDRSAFLTMAVFEYLVGNTDWSVQYLQNIKLIAQDSLGVPVTVPYDFDHAGIVSTPYAKPAEELRMNSVRERRYRGYCVQDMKVFESIISKFNQLKDDIYKLYNDCRLLDARYIKNTIRYLDEFYATIKDTKSWQKDFSYPCDPKGTGNIIIRGLKED